MENSTKTINENLDEISLEKKSFDLTNEDEKDIENIIKCIDSKKNVIKKSLKLMNGKHGGGFYVKYLQDDVKKVGWLQLIIEYPDESYKTIILYKNCFKETSIDDNDGVCNESKPKNLTKSQKTIPKWDGLSGSDWYSLEKYATPNMPIPGRVLWKLINMNYEQIPVVKIYNSVTIQDIYHQMASVAIGYSKNKEEYKFMNGNDRYFVPVDDFKEIAVINNYNLNELRISLDMMGLLIKDKSKGYQYSKRIYGKRVRFYVIKKQLGDNLEEPINDKAVDFMTDVVCKEQNEIDELNEKIKEMQKFILDNADKLDKKDLTKAL